MNNQHLKADYCVDTPLFAYLCGKLGQSLIEKADLSGRFAHVGNQMLLLSSFLVAMISHVRFKAEAACSQYLGRVRSLHLLEPSFCSASAVVFLPRLQAALGNLGPSAPPRKRRLSKLPGVNVAELRRRSSWVHGFRYVT